MDSATGLILYFILTIWLGWIVWCDIKSFRIPDYLSLPLVLAGVLVNAAWGIGLTNALWGGGIGYVSFVLVETGYRSLRKREGLGRGDAKLAAAGGAWCGSAALPVIVTIAALSALLFLGLRSIFSGRVRAGNEYLPFAPFLCAAILAVFSQRLLADLAG